MKRIPAGILLLTLAFTAPLSFGLHAEETASQLADETLGSDQSMSDETASQLSEQDLGPDQNMKDETASQLSNGTLGPDQSMSDETASQLSKQDLGPDQNMKDETAGSLAEKENLEKKPKVISSQPAGGFGMGEGVDGIVYAIAAQPDGSVVIGGRFESVNGQPRMNLARFNPDGSLDPKFSAGTDQGVEGTIYALAIDSKGAILAGGYFTSAQDQPQKNFARYLADGKLDTAFANGQSPNGAVYAIAVQPNGEIVIGGEFSGVGANPRRNLARFKADGTLEASVTSAEATTGAVRGLSVLPKGGILAGGKFDIAGQTARNLLLAP